MRPDKATARVHAAVIPFRLESRELCDAGLNALPRGEVHLRESIGELLEHLSGHMSIDFESKGAQELEVILSEVLR